MKTDNGLLDSKLELRKYFLEKYFSGGKISVVDCCAGYRVIWNKLGKMFDMDYTGIEKRKIKGTIHGDSLQFLRSGGAAFANVVDIDTYGNPWRHYIEAQKKHPRGVVVYFLTSGSKGVAVQPEALLGLGIRYAVPSSLAVQLCGEYEEDVVRGLTIGNMIEFAKAKPNRKTSGRETRYYGVSVEYR